jgi:hypothetical protein
MSFFHSFNIFSSWLTLNNITTLYPFETEEHETGEATCWYSFLKSDLDLAGSIGKMFEQFLPWLEGFYLICKETFIKVEKRFHIVLGILVSSFDDLYQSLNYSVTLQQCPLPKARLHKSLDLNWLCFLPLVDYLYLGWYYPCLVIFLL